MAELFSKRSIIMEDNDEKYVGRGTVTLAQVESGIELKTDNVLTESKHQLVGGCLDEVSPVDQTGFMLKKETIFYVDTDAMREAGNISQANHLDAQKNVMLEARASANKAFDEALKLVAPDTAEKAIQVLNHAKELVYYNNFNNYQQHADRTSLGISSQSELELSWVKTKLAAQLADGSFKREIDAREQAGATMVCEDHSLVR
jgi:hypothetical protein